MLCSNLVTVRRKKPPVTADSTPDQQTAALDPFAVRDRLQRQFTLLGVGVHVGVTTLGPKHVITYSSMWVGDAHKVAEALDRLPVATKEG
jgi:hypothetical protein